MSLPANAITLEHPLVKVPFESLNNVFRKSQKVLEKELSTAASWMNELTSKPERDSKAAVDTLITRLTSLKRKFEELSMEEEVCLESCRVRLEHLSSYGGKGPASASPAEAQKMWEKTRLDRYLVDYMLREGHYETARKLAKGANVEEYVDIDLFVEAQKIEDALLRHDCTQALAWCADNKSRLKKIKSSLEFDLRVQEYVELVRKGDRVAAISYAKKFLAQNADTNMAEIQRAMALLAFSADTDHPVYKRLFDVNRWYALVDEFRHDSFVLNSLTTEPLLAITLQAGLSSLKTPMCFREDSKNPNCPVCMPALNDLAKELPSSHRVRSSLVCRITGKPINEDNPPMVLPNGYVYSQAALTDMAKLNDGDIICPRSKDRFRLSDARKVFIM
eukprot:Opistho-2@62104